MMLCGHQDSGYQQQTQQSDNYVSVSGQLISILVECSWISLYLNGSTNIWESGWKQLRNISTRWRVNTKFKLLKHGRAVWWGSHQARSYQYGFITTEKNSLSEILGMQIMHFNGTRLYLIALVRKLSISIPLGYTSRMTSASRRLEPL